MPVDWMPSRSRPGMSSVHQGQRMPDRSGVPLRLLPSAVRGLWALSERHAMRKGRRGEELLPLRSPGAQVRVAGCAPLAEAAHLQGHEAAPVAASRGQRGGLSDQLGACLVSAAASTELNQPFFSTG